MGNKKTSGQIKENIMFKLREGPLTITEISESIKSNWLTTEKFLKELRDSEEVSEVISSPKIKMYRRTDDPVYYGLPFSKKIRDETIYLLLRILELWREEKRVYPNKTTTQKIAVEVIKDCDLDLPILEFHYGKVTCISLAPGSKIEQIYEIVPPNNADNIKRCIKKILKKSEHTGISSEEREKQYKNENMNFYQAKEDVVKSFDRKNKDIIDAFSLLSLNFPIKLQEFYSEFNDYISTSIALLSINSNDDNLRKIKETFYSLWDILTTLSFFKDAEKYIELKKRDLLVQMRDVTLNSKKMGYSNLFSEMESELIDLDKLKMPDGEESIQIQKLIRESIGGN